jgi:hypothetical protein
VNVDQSIHRMAFREAETLGLAQVLVVKKRQELDLRLQRERVAEGSPASGASIERTLDDMQRTSEASTREPAPVNDSGVLVDKTA